jgi:DnaJ-class molecular chaperone
MGLKDYCSIVDIHVDASGEDIKRAFRPAGMALATAKVA